MLIFFIYIIFDNIKKQTMDKYNCDNINLLLNFNEIKSLNNNGYFNRLLNVIILNNNRYSYFETIVINVLDIIHDEHMNNISLLITELIDYINGGVAKIDIYPFIRNIYINLCTLNRCEKNEQLFKIYVKSIFRDLHIIYIKQDLLVENYKTIFMNKVIAVITKIFDMIMKVKHQSTLSKNNPTILLIDSEPFIERINESTPNNYQFTLPHYNPLILLVDNELFKTHISNNTLDNIDYSKELELAYKNIERWLIENNIFADTEFSNIINAVIHNYLYGENDLIDKYKDQFNYEKRLSIYGLLMNSESTVIIFMIEFFELYVAFYHASSIEKYIFLISLINNKRLYTIIIRSDNDRKKYLMFVKLIELVDNIFLHQLIHYNIINNEYIDHYRIIFLLFFIYTCINDIDIFNITDVNIYMDEFSKFIDENSQILSKYLPFYEFINEYIIQTITQLYVNLHPIIHSSRINGSFDENKLQYKSDPTVNKIFTRSYGEKVTPMQLINQVKYYNIISEDVNFFGKLKKLSKLDELETKEIKEMLYKYPNYLVLIFIYLNQHNLSNIIILIIKTRIIDNLLYALDIMNNLPKKYLPYYLFLIMKLGEDNYILNYDFVVDEYITNNNKFILWYSLLIMDFINKIFDITFVAYKYMIPSKKELSIFLTKDINIKRESFIYDKELFPTNLYYDVELLDNNIKKIRNKELIWRVNKVLESKGKFAHINKIIIAFLLDAKLNYNVNNFMEIELDKRLNNYDRYILFFIAYYILYKNHNFSVNNKIIDFIKKTIFIQNESNIPDISY